MSNLSLILPHPWPSVQAGGLVSLSFTAEPQRKERGFAAGVETKRPIAALCGMAVVAPFGLPPERVGLRAASNLRDVVGAFAGDGVARRLFHHGQQPRSNSTS